MELQIPGEQVIGPLGHTSSISYHTSAKLISEIDMVRNRRELDR